MMRHLPVAKYLSVKTIIAIVAHMRWRIHQIDVRTVFLNWVVEEEIYIEQPEGSLTCSRENRMCRLERALYGLKQAPRAWYARINKYLQGLSFTKTEADSSI